jgi:ribosome-associated protein
MNPDRSIQVTLRISIPLSEIELSYARSSGPGGQNVNKVASKAVLRFDLAGSPSIPEPARQRALRRLENRVTKHGEIVLSCDTHRDQTRNREEAISRLQSLLAEAMNLQRRRRPTRPTKAAKERRLQEKRTRAGVKQQRGRVGAE